MTTIEFVTKCLNKAKLTLEIQQQRKVTQDALKNLEEKVVNYKEILAELEEAEFIRKYIFDKGLLYDVLACGRKEGFWE